MNKVFFFLVTILSIFIIDLFQFDAPPSLSQDINSSISTDAIAAYNDSDVDLNLEFDFLPIINSQKSGDASSMEHGLGFDPVTMLLLGGGLIGLAGLGKKKT
jgi:hypothetical protein